MIVHSSIFVNGVKIVLAHPSFGQTLRKAATLVVPIDTIDTIDCFRQSILSLNRFIRPLG